MKVNRRGFFAAAAAAPVAVKQAVTSVLDYEKYFEGPSTGRVLGGLPSSSDYAEATAHKGWLQEKLEGLVARRRGAVSGALYGDCHRDHVAYIQIDNRRATSPVMRALFIAEEKERREKARELSYLDQQIEEVKKKLGIFGGIL
jgi:hypothetical protein